MSEVRKAILYLCHCSSGSSNNDRSVAVLNEVLESERVLGSDFGFEATGIETAVWVLVTNGGTLVNGPFSLETESPFASAVGLSETAACT